MTIDSEIMRLRDLEHVTSILVTHQLRDAFFIATHEAVRTNGGLQFRVADPAKAAQVAFMVLHEARIHFHGSAAELLASPDPYLWTYLLKTLPPW